MTFIFIFLLLIFHLVLKKWAVNRNTGEKIKWNCEGETKGIEQVKGCRNELIRHVPVTGYGPYICTWTSEEQLAQIKGHCRLKHHTDLKQVFWGRASKKLELGSGFMVFADLSCRSLLPSVWHSFVYLFLVLCFFSQIRYLRKSKGWLLTPEIWEKMVCGTCMCVFSHSVMSDSLYHVDCSPLGSSVHGILQARILEWVAISFSRGSFLPRDQTHVSFIGRSSLLHSATWLVRVSP